MDQQHESSDFDQPSTQEAEYTSGEDERHHLIAETAYFIAEQRGFQGGDALEDWLQAEAKVEAIQKEGQGDQ